jgi:hypothetical protein
MSRCETLAQAMVNAARRGIATVEGTLEELQGEQYSSLNNIFMSFCFMT